MIFYGKAYCKKHFEGRKKEIAEKKFKQGQILVVDDVPGCYLLFDILLLSHDRNFDGFQ